MNDIIQPPAWEAGPLPFKWSSYQDAIRSAARESGEPLIIQGVAGCAKTTTLISLTEFTGPSTLFLAFNKHNAEETRAKITQGESKTLNALGHRLWMLNAPGARLDARKTEKLVEQIMPPEPRKKFGYLVQRIVGAAKGSGLGIDQEVNSSDFNRFILNGDWDIDDSDIETAAHYAAKVFNLSRSDLQTFDFDDQLYGPVYHDWAFPSFDTVLVDEAQDLNRIQHLFLEKLCAERQSRLIAVGDRNQAIYGFRGALPDSMDLLKAHFRMVELPLSITYRCPLSVVLEAQQYVPHIQARDGAPAGEVLWSKPDDGDPQIFPNGWLIICRNNAPLFAAVMQHVRARTPCRVLSNALEGLASFIKRFRAADTQTMLFRLDRWLTKETLAAESKGMPWKVAALTDKAETIRSLSEGFSTVEEILNVLRQLSESRSGPLFSTIHKAKGLEAEHVYFLRPDLVPGWWIKETSALQQEYNLRYVAITRAQQSLTYGVKK